jgi:hypothetical protein
MTRSHSFILFALGLAACAPAVPDSSGGVGFQDYGSYIRGAEPAPLPGPVTPAPTVLPPGAAPNGVAPNGFDPAAASAAIDRADGRLPATDPLAAAPVPTPGVELSSGPLDANRPRGDAPTGIAVETGEIQRDNAAISDEQDFDAVSARETIESDKARIEQNRAQYVVVQPGELPTRPGETGPNIVEYALATTHAPGVQLHPRRSIVARDPASACAKFGSPDLAQQEFLARGGPDRDRLGLDPDGDGYACTWDPRPFRNALK